MTTFKADGVQVGGPVPGGKLSLAEILEIFAAGDGTIVMADVSGRNSILGINSTSILLYP